MIQSESLVLDKTVEFETATSMSGATYIVTSDEHGGNARVSGGTGKLTFVNRTSTPLRLTFTAFGFGGNPRLLWPFENDAPADKVLRLGPGEPSDKLEINGVKNSGRWSGLMVFKYTVEAPETTWIRLDPTIIVDH